MKIYYFKGLGEEDCPRVDMSSHIEVDGLVMTVFKDMDISHTEYIEEEDLFYVYTTSGFYFAFTSEELADRFNVRPEAL